MKGDKELIITGSLGDVMRESVQAALSYIRSNAAAFGIAENFFEHQDIHIHVPSGGASRRTARRQASPSPWRSCRF